MFGAVNVEDRCLESAKDVADALPMARREAVADRACRRLLGLDFRERVAEAEGRRWAQPAPGVRPRAPAKEARAIRLRRRARSRGPEVAFFALPRQCSLDHGERSLCLLYPPGDKAPKGRDCDRDRAL